MTSPSPSKNFSILYLLLMAVVGIIILLPSLDYQPLLSQGDHGRDLYCFEKSSQGQMAYRDYWWVYGPLMPCYYGFLYKLYGVSMLTALLGKSLLTLTAGLLFFLILNTFISPAFAILGSTWFLLFNQDFFFTYNHAGGILMILAVLYCITRYIKDPAEKYLSWGLM